MEDDMIERVAAAILAKRYENDGGRFATHPEHDLALARAAIEAMREPTEAMVRHAYAAMEDDTPPESYRNMIDAALR
jgi:hypothetical protein